MNYRHILLPLAVALTIASRTSAQEAMHGTAIAIIRTAHEIVAAADSRVVNGDGVPDQKPLCKIRQVRNLFFVVNGMSEDAPSGFDVFQIIDNGLQEQGGFFQRIEKCEQLIKRPLEKALERLRVEKPQTFQQNFTKMAPLGVSFFGFETNTLFLYRRRFIIDSPSNHPVTVYIERNVCPGVDCPAGVGTVFVGPPEDTKKFEGDNPDYWKTNLVESTRRFVQMRIDKKTVSVGPPIDIIRVTVNGAEWIQRKMECPDIRP